MKKVVQKVVIKALSGVVEPKEFFLEKREKGKGRMRERENKKRGKEERVKERREKETEKIYR